MSILVTGGCGFIGGNFILDYLASGGEKVINLDLLTYAGNRSSLAHLPLGSYELIRGDIRDQTLLEKIFSIHQPEAIVHFAAESHVDRSILGPETFIETNVLGTLRLLEMAKNYWKKSEGDLKENFRYIQISTDEVYGSLGPDDPPFKETTPYSPNNPYSASKAAGDHLARAYFHTYGLPVITSNCSNNYGPYQFPEKLIPLMILNALGDKPLPIYGDGLQIRDWLFVSDHTRALRLILKKGTPGQTYNIGGNSEKTNLEVVKTICRLLDSKKPKEDGKSYAELITQVKDRPGHDRRYAIDASKIKKELGFEPKISFEEGLNKTIDWYLDNKTWVDGILTGEYRSWLDTQYGQS
ncbi:MAG: dTDP-glucose 4,6-dehydratase [Deltaproteobacteria bacterium]|jgi:dTDP-glucose 4,6-dehydratase|nr:dTDP-glucose 4,6-dehydratase [Deltaproteobacteria bacterium]